MRLIAMGTGPFAVPAFRAVLAAGHQVLGLVTRPIEDAGRRKSPANPMRDAATAAGIPVFTPIDVNDPAFIERLRELHADLFFVCDFGQILSAECLAAACLGGVNLHGSLLPKYRGAAPVHWAIYHGDQSTGVSVIHMTPRLDGGPILAAVESEIGPNETTEQLETRLAQLGVDAVLQAIRTLEQWDGKREIGRPQDASQVSRAPRLNKKQGRIDWSKSATQIRYQIRAFTPWPGSYCDIPRPNRTPLRLIVHAAQVQKVETGGHSGTILEATPDRLVVACGTTEALSLTTVQPAGKRIMGIGEFLRGYSIRPGDRLE